MLPRVQACYPDKRIMQGFKGAPLMKCYSVLCDVQRVHLTFNQRVTGSNPVALTKFHRDFKNLTVKQIVPLFSVLFRTDAC